MVKKKYKSASFGKTSKFSSLSGAQFHSYLDFMEKHYKSNTNFLDYLYNDFKDFSMSDRLVWCINFVIFPCFFSGGDASSFSARVLV